MVSVSKLNQIVVIAASTGGPKALMHLLKGLPADISAPILVVQHISDDFTETMVGWLDNITPLSVKIPFKGEKVKEGTVYVAPNKVHMSLSMYGRIYLSNGDPVDGHIPSADILFSSVADCANGIPVGIILTGMGSDGAKGILDIRNSGGYTIAQDEKTSTVFGMPRAAIECGAIDSVLPLEGISGKIINLMKNG